MTKWISLPGMQSWFNIKYKSVLSNISKNGRIGNSQSTSLQKSSDKLAKNVKLKFFKTLETNEKTYSSKGNT